MAKKKRDMIKINPDGQMKMQVSISRIGNQAFTAMAEALKMNRTQFFEQLSRGNIDICSDGSELTLVLKTNLVDSNENDTAATYKSTHKQQVVQVTAKPNNCLSEKLSSESQHPEMALAPQSEEQASFIADLKHKIADLEQQLQQETRKNSAVSLEQYQALEQNSAAQANRIQELEQQVTNFEQQVASLQAEANAKVAAEEYHALRTQWEQQTHRIGELEQQVASLQAEANAKVAAEEYHALRTQWEQQTHRIGELEQQVASLQAEANAKVAAEEYHALRTQWEQQYQAIAALEKQLQECQKRVSQTVPSEIYQGLQRQFEQQARSMSVLQAEVSNLRSLAIIGESMLNKWQLRNFSQ